MARNQKLDMTNDIKLKAHIKMTLFHTLLTCIETFGHYVAVDSVDVIDILVDKNVPEVIFPTANPLRPLRP